MRVTRLFFGADPFGAAEDAQDLQKLSGTPLFEAEECDAKVLRFEKERKEGKELTKIALY